jgi:hypothetical protein
MGPGESTSDSPEGIPCVEDLPIPRREHRSRNDRTRPCPSGGRSAPRHRRGFRTGHAVGRGRRDRPRPRTVTYSQHRGRPGGRFFRADRSDRAPPGSPSTHRVIRRAVRWVAEEGLPYRVASGHLGRDHRVCVPFATLPNGIAAAGTKIRRPDGRPVPGRGPDGIFRLPGRRRVVRGPLRRPVRRRCPPAATTPRRRVGPRSHSGRRPVVPGAPARPPPRARSHRGGDHHRGLATVSPAQRVGVPGRSPPRLRVSPPPGTDQGGLARGRPPAQRLGGASPEVAPWPSAIDAGGPPPALPRSTNPATGGRPVRASSPRGPTRLAPTPRTPWASVRRGRPGLRARRAIREEVDRWFARRCRTATARSERTRLRRRVRRFRRRGKSLDPRYSPDREKARNVREDKRLPATSHAVERGNRRSRPMQKALDRVRTPAAIPGRRALDRQRDRPAEARSETSSCLHRARAGPRNVNFLATVSSF